ncbi:MAG: hypothetical protein KDK36_09425 [Leptospiraceae bacterium]|nr:hypothetical protein [Leptospiraceae bacterium]
MTGRIDDASYRQNPEYQKLDALLVRTIPNFKDIEEALNHVPPVIISSAIINDVGFTYLLDYYLRYVSANTVCKILQNPMFEKEALMELFYCQVTNYHKAILQKKPVPELISSYWTYLSKAEYAILFKYLLLETRDTDATKSILRNVDILHLKMMTSSGSIPSDKVLGFFKRLGSEIQKIAAQDMQVYDFVFELATTNSDEDYLAYLEEYTALFVQLRVASFFTEDIEKEMKKSERKLTYLEILEKVANIPHDSQEISLQIFKERGWISPQEAQTIKEFYDKPKK